MSVLRGRCAGWPDRAPPSARDALGRLAHLALHNAGKRLATESPVALTPFQSFRLRARHQLEGNSGSSHPVALGVLLVADLSNPPSTPSHSPDTNSRTSPAGWI